MFPEESDQADAYYNRGRVCYELGEFQPAIADYDQAIRLYKDDQDKAKTYNNRGLAYHDQGELEKAIDDYAQAILLCSDKRILAIMHRNRANALIDAKRLREAELDCKAAQNFEPDHPYTRARWAKLYYVRGDNHRSLESYRQAAQLASNPAEFNLELALPLLCLGQSEQALEAVEAGLKQVRDGNYLINVLRAYRKLGREQPNLPGLDEAIELLESVARKYLQ